MGRPRLSFLDRWLTLWIALAMVAGVLLGRFSPGVVRFLSAASVGSTSLPIAAGLVLMMVPPFSRVRPSRLDSFLSSRRVLWISLGLNWVVGPLLMFFLGVLFLRDRPDLFAGLVLVGLARCIAMVVVWNQLAGGSAEAAAGLVAFNSLFQVLTYGLYAMLFLTVAAPFAGLPSQEVSVSGFQVAGSVLLYLGLPAAVGMGLRRWLVATRGEAGAERFNARLAPLTLVALLFTVVAMFALQGERILAHPLEVVRVGVPLTVYFGVMFAISWIASRSLGLDRGQQVAQSLTAASNNFELAIAVAIGSFGLGSGAAFAATIGPLVEVPVMLGLVGWIVRRPAQA